MIAYAALAIVVTYLVFIATSLVSLGWQQAAQNAARAREYERRYVTLDAALRVGEVVLPAGTCVQRTGQLDTSITQWLEQPDGVQVMELPRAVMVPGMHVRG